MSGEDGLNVVFTDVLYGVVVANGIYQLTLDVTLRTMMLLFALVVILGDWVEYQVSVETVPDTARNYALALVLDVVILVVWYFLTILPSSDLSLFFGFLAAFFFLQAVWDALLLELPALQLLRQGHVQLVAPFVVLGAAAEALDQFQVALLAIGFVLFVFRKTFVWQDLLQENPEPV